MPIDEGMASAGFSQRDLERRANLGKQLTRARAALQKRDTDLALEILDASRVYALDPDEKAMRARLVTLADYVAEYWDAADDRLKKISSGSEVTLSGQRIMVVEKSDTRLVLRAAGQNKTYDVNNLPIPVSIGLAESWFDRTSPTTKVFRGAMMAVTPGFETSEARRLWREAQESGEISLGDLEQVLDEDYGTLSKNP